VEWHKENTELLAFVIHFPYADDFLFYKPKEEDFPVKTEDPNVIDLNQFVIMRISNPFFGLKVREDMRPVVNNWLYASLSTFGEKSYLQVYRLPDIEICNKLAEKKREKVRMGMVIFDDETDLHSFTNLNITTLDVRNFTNVTSMTTPLLNTST
jgi:hypothetical protein